MKSVPIRSFSGQHFSAFELDTERYEVSLRIQSECGKILTRKTPNTGAFHAVGFFSVKILTQKLTEQRRIQNPVKHLTTIFVKSSILDI